MSMPIFFVHIFLVTCRISNEKMNSSTIVIDYDIGRRMKALAGLFLAFSLNSFGQTKMDVEKTLNHMRDAGIFSPQQIEAARKQLQGMSASDFKSLQKAAQEKANDPAIQKKAQEILNQRNPASH